MPNLRKMRLYASLCYCCLLLFGVGSAGLPDDFDPASCLGVSLGPKIISIAKPPNGSLPGSTSTTRFTVGSQDQSWLARSPKDHDQFSSSVSRIFPDARDTAKRVFGKRAKAHVFAISSEMWEDRTVIDVIRKQAPLIDLADNHDLLFIRPGPAVKMAYDLGTCEGLGLPPTCDVQDETRPILWIDYNEVALTISMLEVSAECAVTLATQAMADMGSVQPASTSSSLAERLTSFLANETLVKPDPAYTNSAWKPLRTDIAAVVFTGDASPAAFATLKTAAKHVFDPLLKPGWMRDSIDPADVVAIGAAKRAVFVMKEGDALLPHLHYLPAEPGHEEL